MASLSFPSIIAGFIAGAIVSAGVTYAIITPSDTASVGLEIPSSDEALAAFKRAKGENATVELGECSKNEVGPGVSCAVDYINDQYSPQRQGIVVFAKTPTGWMAQHMF